VQKFPVSGDFFQADFMNINGKLFLIPALSRLSGELYDNQAGVKQQHLKIILILYLNL